MTEQNKDHLMVFHVKDAISGHVSVEIIGPLVEQRGEGPAGALFYVLCFVL